jgi:hypothetical protein
LFIWGELLLAPNKIYADFVPIGGEDLVGNLLAMPPNLIFPKKKKRVYKYLAMETKQGQ